MAQASVIDQGRRVAERATDEHKLEMLAKVGAATKGALYAVIGILALRAAFGGGGGTVGSKGALMEIASQPFGMVLLGLMAAGLFANTLFRFASAYFDLDGHGSDAKGIVTRAAEAGSGLIYGALGVWAATILAGSGSGGSGGGSKQAWTAQILQNSWGKWLIGAVAVAAFVGAAAQFVKAFRHKFMEKLEQGRMDQKEQRLVKRAGEIGFSGRGVVFAMIGWFYLRAALQRDPSEVGGVDKVLTTLQGQAWGPWLLGAMALALLAYAAYCGFLAKYRRVVPAHR